MNNWNGVGRLGGDAESRYTTSGTAVSSFNLALDTGKDKEGNKRKPVWIKVVLWAKQAEALAKYLTKGKEVAISGEIAEPEAWINKADGTAHARTVITGRNVTLLGSKSDSVQQETAAPAEEPADDNF